MSQVKSNRKIYQIYICYIRIYLIYWKKYIQIYQESGNAKGLYSEVFLYQSHWI